MSTPTIIRHKTHKTLIAVVITYFDRYSQLVAAVQIYKTHKTLGGTALIRSFGEFPDEQSAIAEYNEIDLEEQHYQAWFAIVAHEVRRQCGVHPDDLPDFDYRAAHDDDQDPTEVAEDVIEHAKSY